MKRYRYIQAAATLFLTAALALTTAPVYIGESSREKQDEEQTTVWEDTQKHSDGEIETGGNAAKADGPLKAVVLGDSIAKGYSSDKEITIQPYGELVMETIAGEQGREYEIANYAKNGLDSERMNTEILPQEQVLSDIREADVIFITVGSNDLLNECKDTVREILNTDTKFRSAEDALKVLEDSMSENPFLIIKIIAALGGWDYESFDDQWTQMMETISSERKEDSEVIATNIYNPVANMELPSTMNGTVEDIIGNMNTIIEGHAGEYGYTTADIFSSEVSVNVQADGLHPDQDGQQIIAEVVCEAYESGAGVTEP